MLSNKLWREYIYIWVTFVEQRALLVRAYTRTMAMSISPSPRARHSRGWICGMLISPSNTLYWKCIRFVTAVWHIHNTYILYIEYTATYSEQFIFHTGRNSYLISRWVFFFHPLIHIEGVKHSFCHLHTEGSLWREPHIIDI